MSLKVALYPCAETKGKTPSAVIIWEDGKICVQTENISLRKTLLDFYGQPISAQQASISKEGMIRSQERQIEVRSEDFLKESVYGLRTLNLFGRLEGEKKMQLVALDFDGTLWDTVHECFVVTYESFMKLGWPLSKAPDLEARFKRGRSFVQKGAEFCLIMKWILEHEDRDPSAMTEPEAVALRANTDLCLKFERMFDAVRKEWRERRFKAWSAMQGPYPGILDQLRQLQESFWKVVVSTTKDADSVKKLLAANGISLDVVGKENTVDKMKQISYLSATFEKPFHEIIFVDDLLDQVQLVKSLGAKVALAGWGYSSNEQKHQTSKLGIPILELDSMADSLKQLF